MEETTKMPKSNFAMPKPPSVWHQRVMKRRALRKLSNDELANYQDPAFPKPGHMLEHRNLDPLAGIALEELICRLVSEHLPEAHKIIVIEDDSHDSPHGHIQHVFDRDRNVIADGSSDEWHELGWTNEVNDLAWDLYYLASPLFSIENSYHHLELIVKA